MNLLKERIVVIGAGGHAKVLVDSLLSANKVVAGLVDSDPSLKDSLVLGIPLLGNDDWVFQQDPTSLLLVNGIGSTTLPSARRAVFERFKARGYRFAQVVHPSAVVGREVELGEGAQVLAGAVVQSGCSLGANSILNTKVSVDHDCVIAAHCHVAPGATLSGSVKVGEQTHIGVGANIIQGVRVGSKCVIGAGALVLREVSSGTTVIGVPAKEVRS